MKLLFQQTVGQKVEVALEVHDELMGPKDFLDGNYARVAFGSLDADWARKEVIAFYNAIPKENVSNWAYSWLTDGVDKVSVLDEHGSVTAIMRHCIILVTKRVFDGVTHLFFEVECLRRDFVSVC